MSYILVAVFVGLLAGIALILKKNVGGAFARALTTSRLIWASILLFLGLAIVITIPKIGGGKEGEHGGTAKRPAQWFLFWEKPAGYDGYNRHERRKEDPAMVQLSGDTLIIRQNPGSTHEVVFTGFREGQTNSFRGDWKQKNNPALQGTFQLTFRPDFGDAVGWLIWKGGNRTKVDLRIYQK